MHYFRIRLFRKKCPDLLFLQYPLEVSDLEVYCLLYLKITGTMLKYSVFQEIIAELKDSVKKNNLQANILSINRKQNSRKKESFSASLVSPRFSSSILWYLVFRIRYICLIWTVSLSSNVGFFEIHSLLIKLVCNWQVSG